MYLFGCTRSKLRLAGSLVVACQLLSCGMHVGSSCLTRDRTQAPCIGCVESHSLRHQGSPILTILFYFKIYLFIYFKFLAALGLRCCAQASHCSGFSCCGAQALGTQASVVVARRLSSCGSRA